MDARHHSSASRHRPDDDAAGGCTGEEGPHKHVCPPPSVSNDSAAAQILDLKAQMTEALVCLEQRVVGVRAEELEGKTHESDHMTTTVKRPRQLLCLVI